MTNKKSSMGLVCTLVGGILWGFSGTCGQYLFSNYEIDAMLITCIRMFTAGIMLVAIGFIKDKNSMTGIWKNKRDVVQLILFAVCGLMFSQFTYMKAISYMNSATATILQYTGPVFIMTATCILKKKLPSLREVVAVLLALAGVFVLATHGNIKTMTITPIGLLWGILSAVGLMLYSMLPEKIMQKYGSITVSGFGMIIGGSVLSVGGRVWNYKANLDFKGILCLGATALLGTVFAYTLYLSGVKYIGAVKASVISCVEPVSSTVFMVLWLHSSFTFIDAVGFALILSTVIILAIKKNNKVKEINNG